VLAALQIARAIKEHNAKVTIFVPHYAMSGGTLIALAADEIVMSQARGAGPDRSANWTTARRPSLIRVVEQKPISEIDDQTLVMADVGRKAIAQLKQSASDILKRRLPPDKADAASPEKLFDRDLDPRTIRCFAGTAKELGLPREHRYPE